MDVGVIILSGGENRRFQKNAITDKSLEFIKEKRMIEWILDIAYEISDDVAVVVRNNEKLILYSSLFLLKYPNLSILKDIQDVEHSPLLGIITGAKYIKKNSLLILPCDTPYIKSELLQLLIKNKKDYDVVAPLWSNGKIEPLLALYRREFLIQISPALLKLDRARSDDIIRSSKKSFLINVNKIKEIDPTLSSFFNINYPEYLHGLYGIEPSYGSLKYDKIIYPNKISEEVFKSIINSILEIIQNIEFESFSKNAYFWSALMALSHSNNTNKKLIKEAAYYFEKESNYYMSEGINMLDLHAKIDALQCWMKLHSANNVKRILSQVENLKKTIDIDFRGRIKSKSSS